MRSLERYLRLSFFATVLVAPACTTVSVKDWPYVLAEADAGPSSDGASDADGGTAGGGQSAPSMDPLACDGALCDTTNYTACNLANNPAAGRTALPLSGLLVGAGMLVARSRTRRQTERRS